jgi:hypothetical protein
MAVDEDIPQEERDALDREGTLGFWKQSKYLRASIIVASLAGIIQGFTQSNSNASNVEMATDFGLHIGPNDPDRNTRDLWLFGLLNAILFFSAGLLYAFFLFCLQRATAYRAQWHSHLRSPARALSWSTASYICRRDHYCHLHNRRSVCTNDISAIGLPNRDRTSTRDKGFRR